MVINANSDSHSQELVHVLVLNNLTIVYSIQVYQFSLALRFIHKFCSNLADGKGGTGCLSQPGVWLCVKLLKITTAAILSMGVLITRDEITHTAHTHIHSTHTVTHTEHTHTCTHTEHCTHTQHTHTHTVVSVA